MSSEKQEKQEKQCKKNSCDYLYYKWLIENGTAPGRPGAPGAPGASEDPHHELKRVLRRLLGKTVTVSTGFAPVTGILSAIEADYIVISEATGSVVFVPLNAIKSVREPI
ncbi:DUF2642 domain-containing protein [Peribacillus simplex]|uniref:DUF2642 domain-containing protein n=1 Tax=Peribacillus simplex TaxID=1478 RepID=UPI00298DA452|nr:DUF2642 domain-containing protein [Peribacillus simplex]MDW7616843.1 DUF2642 domain-containing protein [Peribacillus simplex]